MRRSGRSSAAPMRNAVVSRAAPAGIFPVGASPAEIYRPAIATNTRVLRIGLSMDHRRGGLSGADYRFSPSLVSTSRAFGDEKRGHKLKWKMVGAGRTRRR